ncbi:phosphatase PAP2 family protein [Corynebacterium sp. 4HC-13]|uniref:Phosphatase PAP2 family protein n=1 Tax=Corynebacterium anserum TaxID=2684406 RepID=A0A7G7YMG4_9CORY|nr:phosphatase PAP2 family protein [Corynebacterium anserum]MBC2681050.1 phosphatase PAP2 family protein [Corynebacterium anserum]QNH95684.1 phosphatase PAP2 family protein [Corynebacterium anserum]
MLKFGRTWSVAIGAFFITVAFVIGMLTRWWLVVDGDNDVLAEFIEHRSSWATVVMKAATTLFNPVSAIVFSLLAGAVAWSWTKQWKKGAYIVASVAVSGAITQVLKRVFERSRPPRLDQILLETDFSFPSGHATAVAALAVGIVLFLSYRGYHRRLEFVVLAIAAVIIATVAASRLYLGAHWFSDILAGTLIGAGTALVLIPILPASARSRSISATS